MGIASDFVLIVVAGLLGGIFARMLRLPLLVGYVIAGVFIGPHTAGPTVVQVHDIELLAEIGVALLLFSLGLEVSFRDLQPVRRVAVFGGGIQIVLVCSVTAFFASQTLKLPAAEALWLGAMFSLSSTMVVLKTLSAQGLTSTLASRVMIGLLVVQDLAVIPMLIILPQLSDLDLLLPKLGHAIAVAAAFLAVIIICGTYLLPKLLKRVLQWGSRELFLITVVAIGVGVGYATYLAGLSFALGAFVAGIILSESEFSHQALSDVVPLRDIFGLLFFVSVGMLFDPQYASAHTGQLALVVPAIFCGKALIIGLSTRAFGYCRMAPWIVGLGLCQIGEFSFVLARSGFSSGLLSRNTYNLALTCTIITMALSPILSGMALPLGRAWQKIRRPAQPKTTITELPAEDFRDHVVVAGYGRTGRAAARALQRAGITVLIVELNHPAYSSIAADELAGLWGDVSREEILRAAHIDNARILLLAIADQNTIRLAIERARRLNSSLVVIARAAGEAQVAELRTLGIAATVQPEFEGGVEMLRQALIRYQYDEDLVRQLVSSLRSELYQIGSTSAQPGI